MPSAVSSRSTNKLGVTATDFAPDKTVEIGEKLNRAMKKVFRLLVPAAQSDSPGRASIEVGGICWAVADASDIPRKEGEYICIPTLNYPLPESAADVVYLRRRNTNSAAKPSPKRAKDEGSGTLRNCPVLNTWSEMRNSSA